MKMQDLRERLEICQELTKLIDYANERIESRNQFAQQWDAVMSFDKLAKVRRDNDTTERAIGRIRQRLSRILMGMYADLTPMDEIYDECNDKVKSIEHQGYFDHPMFYETNENFNNLGL